MTDKVLGHATAYAYYKAGGGTMTEAEFTEFMADFGTASQTAVEAAQAALASKNAAQTAATTATNKASEATTAATTATTKAAEAQADADAAALDASQALSAASTATTKATEATTAAATATSAATTATTAKNDAVSAKTAAQTAQTGAETAAASVAGSAAQIQENADDIAQLKSDLNYCSKYKATVIDGYYIQSNTGDAVPDTSSDGKKCTDFIPVSYESFVNVDVGFTSAHYRACYLYGYDINKTFIGRITYTEGGSYSKYTLSTKIDSASVKYIRLSINCYSDTLSLKVNVYNSGSEALQESYAYTDTAANSIKNSIALFADHNYCTDYGWRNASISSADGSETIRNDRICTDYLPNVSSVVCKNDYYGLISYYKADKTWISVTSFTKNFTITQASFPANTAYVRIAIHNNTSSINISEGTNCDIRFSIQGLQKDLSKLEKNVHDDKIGRIKKTIKFMSRHGAFVGLPYNNLVSIQNAFDYGYDSIRLDVRWTTDNVPVIQHDDSINAVAKNPDGTDISGDVKISEHTLAELNAYDFGIRYGAQYAGMEITQLEDALELCKTLGMECSLEIKPTTVTTAQFNSMIAAIVKYSMAKYVFIRSHTQAFLTDVHTSAPALNIEVSSGTELSEATQLLDVDFAISMKSSFNTVRLGFAYSAGTTTFNDSVLKKAQMNGIEVIAASVYDDEDMLELAVSKIPIIETAYVKYPYEVFLDSLNS